MLDEAQEVLAVGGITPVPLTRPWYRGLTNVRGNLYSVVDFARFSVGSAATLSPDARLVIQLLEIEDRSVKEISKLTGWSVPLVKVRAFRARAEMRKILARLAQEKYL